MSRIPLRSIRATLADSGHRSGEAQRFGRDCRGREKHSPQSTRAINSHVEPRYAQFQKTTKSSSSRRIAIAVRLTRNCEAKDLKYRPLKEHVPAIIRESPRRSLQRQRTFSTPASHRAYVTSSFI